MLHAVYRFLTCAAIAALFGGAVRAEAQTPSSPAPSSSPSASQSPTPNGNAIEITILAYQGLQRGANAIANAIQPALPTSSPAKIIIATPADVAAILQLRLVRFQITVLNSRLNTLEDALSALPCVKPTTPPKPKPSPRRGGPPGLTTTAAASAAIVAGATAIGDIATMLTQVAQLTAVNEGVTSQSGAFTDATLVNLVGESLASLNSVSVYIPSMAAPNFYDVNDLNLKGTYLFNDLQTLDKDRLQLEKSAQSILSNPACAKTNERGAATKLVVAALMATDKFESGLFGGGLAVPATGLITALNPPAPTAAKPQQPPPKPSAIVNTVSITNQPQSSKSSGPSGPSAVERLLYVDLLLHQLGVGDPYFPNDTYLLFVHALESGGTELTKGSAFLGTRQYFSGGAIATFALLNRNGSTLCSGLVYGYRGYIAAGDFSYAVEPVTSENTAHTPAGNALPSAEVYKPSCPANLHSF